MLYSETGQVVNEHGGRRVSVRKGQAGWVLYGPYVTLSPGRYSVEFPIDADPAVPAEEVCCDIDVVAGFGTRLLTQKRLTGADLLRSGKSIALQFDTDAEDVFEFRIASTGAGAFIADVNRPLKRIDLQSGQISDVNVPETTNEFFKTHVAEFKHFEKNGFTFEATASDIIADFSGTRFHVYNVEDLQVVSEIFVNNEYNFISGRDKIIVDIGMNVGLASLFMARDPTVREVHAFEPFSLPHARALKNFALNPQIAAKIRPNQFGLGEKDEQTQVMVRSDATIGISVRGADTGKPETIHIREAAAVIAPLAERARKGGMDLIIKMDCEGSEFGIFEALERQGLFGSIHAMVIEWHKWWAEGKTQMTLIAPLLEAGFIVLDKTQLSNPHAGLCYAIRAAR
ncbi:FkbM family methyltransferase [Rhizobium sp. P38BS-XIX]|uniref:FkbM family methyltransferase n=1 Tax=Rhizobium sp. P38BS-XIX TaxID=2726740 RepID=UPI00145680A7|nr:FkbM family methyltransferase [Rhizobium sp. P38BS-XIX]NLR99027.1 FkbM family methyltransferase [Rhizobium sp. P38BS-XIX]